MTRKDIEDKLRAVDDARLQDVLERALLRRIELVVDEQHFGGGLLVRPFELVHLALAEIPPPLRTLAVLDDRSDRLDERRARKLVQLGQLVVGIDSLGQHRCDQPALQRGIRLAWDHETIMTSHRQNPSEAR